jgi:hypothetical protein
MTPKRLVVPVAVMATAALTLAAPPLTQAAAPTAKADVTVTIDNEQTDIFGTLKSPRRVCKAEREVRLIKQKGSRGGGDDSHFANDTTDLQGGRWVWETGQLGTEGRFYARVKATPNCKADESPTIRVQRDN